MNNIKWVADYHLERVEHHQGKIAEIQKICQHDDVKASYGSNTGNYDPSNDSYWINVECLDCSKKFRAYSEDNKEEYLKWSARVK